MLVYKLIKYENLMESILPLLGIVITTIVAIYSISKTAKSNRVSLVHNEMLSCLIESNSFIREISRLLEDVSNNVQYHSLPENKIIQSAYERYWEKIDGLSKSFNKMQNKQMFVLPKPLYDNLQNLIVILNNARNEVKYFSSDTKNSVNESNNFKEVLKEFDENYVKFIELSRQYLGVDELKRLSSRNNRILGIEDQKSNH